jgi:L-serine kinase (ADP)
VPINGIKLLKEALVLDEKFVGADEILCHEEVVVTRMNRLFEYLKSLGDTVVIPSILVCSSSNVLIDGHHRYHAMKALGLSNIPVTYLDYASDSIIAHIDNPITKKIILDSAKNNKLLKPKSSFHHIVDERKNVRPVILMSSLVDIKLN